MRREHGVDGREVVPAAALHQGPGDALPGHGDAEPAQVVVVLLGPLAVLRLGHQVAPPLVLPEEGGALEAREEERGEDARPLGHRVASVRCCRQVYARRTPAPRATRPRRGRGPAAAGPPGTAAPVPRPGQAAPPGRRTPESQSGLRGPASARARPGPPAASARRARRDSPTWYSRRPPTLMRAKRNRSLLGSPLPIDGVSPLGGIRPPGGGRRGGAYPPLPPQPAGAAVQ